MVTRYELRYRSLTFYTSSYEIKVGEAAWAPIPIPPDANVGAAADGPARVLSPVRPFRRPSRRLAAGTFADQLLVTLRSAWLGHPAGALLAAPADGFMGAGDDAARSALLTPLFTPTETCSLEARAEEGREGASPRPRTRPRRVRDAAGTQASTETKNYLVLSCLDNVVTECRFWRPLNISHLMP